MTQEQAVKTIKEICKMAIDHDWMPAWRIVDVCAMVLHPRIDQLPGFDSARPMANQCIHCGQEMSEGDQVCEDCRRQHEY